jgi:hypothetical protein
MFNINRAGARLLPGHRKAFSITSILGFALCIGFCVVLWAVAHYEFGFYFDRAHSRGSRIYRVNSYEQFIKQKTGEGPVASVA